MDGCETIDISNHLREIYESRNILHSLIIKNLFGRYRNTYFGFAWHFFTPAIMMLVYFFAFTQLRTAQLDNFWIYLGSGLFPFTFMVTNLTGGSGTIVSNSGMIKKMYFPREILVLSQVISTFIIMLLGYVIIVIAMVITGFELSITILLLPIIFLLMFLFVYGYTLLFSSIAVYSRDLQYFLSSISIVFIFMTPMYFTVDSVAGPLSTLIWFNPFTYARTANVNHAAVGISQRA